MIYPKKRDLDGVYFRIKRNGKWCNRCFTDLTAAEQDEMMSQYNLEQCLRMLSLMQEAMNDFAAGALKDENEVAVLAKSVAYQIRQMGDILDVSRGVSED